MSNRISLKGAVALVSGANRGIGAAFVSGLLEAGELPDKFARLTRAALGDRSAALLARLQRLEDESSLDWLGAPTP